MQLYQPAVTDGNHWDTMNDPLYPKPWITAPRGALMIAGSTIVGSVPTTLPANSFTFTTLSIAPASSGTALLRYPPLRSRFHPERLADRSRSAASELAGVFSSRVVRRQALST
jgi:hypothetical protein